MLKQQLLLSWLHLNHHLYPHPHGNWRLTAFLQPRVPPGVWHICSCWEQPLHCQQLHQQTLQGNDPRHYAKYQKIILKFRWKHRSKETMQSELKEQRLAHHNNLFQDILQNNSQKIMTAESTLIHRSMEQNKDFKNKFTGQTQWHSILVILNECQFVF